MVVKENQPALYAAIALVFRMPPPPHDDDHVDARHVGEKAHGRLETRTVERTCALNGYLDWPDVGQVLRRTCQRIIMRTGEVSEAVTFGLTSLSWRRGERSRSLFRWLAPATPFCYTASAVCKWRNGSRASLRSWCPRGRVGSSSHLAHQRTGAGVRLRRFGLSPGCAKARML